jgi:hypothetical protein
MVVRTIVALHVKYKTVDHNERFSRIGFLSAQTCNVENRAHVVTRYKNKVLHEQKKKLMGIMKKKQCEEEIHLRHWYLSEIIVAYV